MLVIIESPCIHHLFTENSRAFFKNSSVGGPCRKRDYTILYYTILYYTILRIWRDDPPDLQHNI